MRITIVGAGFSGSALASELAWQAGPDVELCLVGVPDSYGRVWPMAKRVPSICSTCAPAIWARRPTSPAASPIGST